MTEQDEHLRTLASRFDDWLLKSALPLWWDVGADRVHGGFHELLGLDGSPPGGIPRRARVQARQSYVYAMAAQLGWSGPWQQAAPHGLDFLTARYRRADGQFRTLVAADATALDDAALLYDQAFALLAMASVYTALPQRRELPAQAHALLERILSLRRHAAGGLVETAPCAFQSNPHMHLLEAVLAWREIEPGGHWDALADEIVALCLTRFIDADGGFLREFFDADWRPAAGAAGRIIEPGHQFEWAWLLERFGRLRRHDGACAAARTLYGIGMRGFDAGRGAAVDEMSDDLAVTRPGARLWPQTEQLKAALILSETALGEEKERYLSDALLAAKALWRYLQTPLPGLWRDKMLPDGTFVEEAAPASSFYHIVCALVSLKHALA